jgi:hypothetical protein
MDPPERNSNNSHKGDIIRRIVISVRNHIPDGIWLLLFIIRVKREIKRVYRHGCRYNERLNPETGGSKTPHVHWVVWVNIQ